MKPALVPIETGRIEDFCSARVAADKKGVSLRAVYAGIEGGRLVGYEVHGQTVVRVADVETWEVRQNKRRRVSKTIGAENG